MRKSNKGGKENPYTLTLFFNYQMFHLHIRQRDDKKYALGKEKPGEQVGQGKGHENYKVRTKFMTTRVSGQRLV